MIDKNFVISDANEAVASVAYRLNELIAIYPITPSSPMAEFSDEWSMAGRENIFGQVPELVQLESEAGVAGSLHGALQCGVLSTTFTASQGLLLMIPNMYKIAGELIPFCMHVTARSLATHALSIFCDHSDVMACRQTGFALLASGSVQEAQDLACIAQASTLESRVPFLHFFDGFRTSHEINMYKPLTDDDLKKMVNTDLLTGHRIRSLAPENPFLRGTAQNPDVFFQGREAANRFYDAAPGIVEKYMNKFHALTGRKYELFQYYGDGNPDRLIICIGSSTEVVRNVVDFLNGNGGHVGLLKIRLFRPFAIKSFVKNLPLSVKAMAVLDRTKEPGAIGEPLYLDVLSAMAEAKNDGMLPESFNPKVIGGRYGLGSKEFSPAMVRAIFDELDRPSPRNHFSIGLDDDVTKKSLAYDKAFQLPSEGTFEAVFFGLGSDGTVGANKNTIKIIGTETDRFVQAYFVYDSKKSGAMTVSHLRFGHRLVEAPYLITSADFVACHQFSFIEKYNILKYLRYGGILLLNSPFSSEHVWTSLPREAQEYIFNKKIKLYAIDAYDVARRSGMGGRINTIMQTCFFAISGILPRNEAVDKIKQSIKKTYAKKGDQVIQKNFDAVDATLDHLFEIKVCDIFNGKPMTNTMNRNAPAFVNDVIAKMIAMQGDDLPVSAFPVDGTWPAGTAKWEKRSIAQEIPEWNPDICIQCNKCSFVCPHAAIRSKHYAKTLLDDKPIGFRSADFRSRDVMNHRFTVQISPADCTGCGLCAEVCPAKAKATEAKALVMRPVENLWTVEQANYEFFEKFSYDDSDMLTYDVKSTQFRRPLFEFSGACAGCGETPYIKLLTQLFGDRAVIANATGCSSIYGGNLPTTPYAVNEHGHGPAWANSLFEDNAEFGFGIRVAMDKKQAMAKDLLTKKSKELGDDFVSALINSPQSKHSELEAQRSRVQELKRRLISENDLESKLLFDLADNLINKSVWIVGGDGWAYDIGYGGLDHVLASGKNVNVLVLDTEVYSNTGGQQSKATPTGAVAKFAANGKASAKKDLGMLSMSYGNIYVAQVAFGANDGHTVKAFVEAESYHGPSLVIAYCHCIAHGLDMTKALEQQRKAVDSGHWPLYRFDPRRVDEGQPAFGLDSKFPKISLAEYMQSETRFNLLSRSNKERSDALIKLSEHRITEKYKFFEMLASLGQ
ncbi:MAG: pyruvate:ferredoxin (flavodoxin) oxidoreductase [Puniceicoccales bacterium]|jgi:pyruvate-ferredoxin/flavodoxin oxidoreductase|nr:pyruvate:ferredoxin (flavodoxin) oxidoreductase [Puniceicoccales bacterium]